MNSICRIPFFGTGAFVLTGLIRATRGFVDQLTEACGFGDGLPGKHIGMVGTGMFQFRCPMFSNRVPLFYLILIVV